MTHVCNVCGRQYKMKFYYDRHILMCDLLSKSSKERTQEDEECKHIPSHHDLYRLVQELGLKCNKMEKQIEKMSAWIDCKKKKINILDWLNTVEIDKDYNVWYDELNIGQEEIKYVFKYDIIKGIVCILEKHLPLTQLETLPIRAFDQRPNILYTNKDGEWIMVSKEDFANLIRNICKKLITEFKTWEKELGNKIKEDKYSILYCQNWKKISGGSYTQEEIINRVKIKIYQYLKINLKNVVQFDITF